MRIFADQGLRGRMTVSVLYCVAVCCSVLQCVALCCSVWQSVKPAFADAAATHFLPSRACVFALVQTATYFNTLQHTATHCNALQVTTTRCNALQRTATHCNALQYTATHHNTLQHTASVVSRRSLPHPLQHTATHRNLPQHTATHCLHSLMVVSPTPSATHCNTLQYTVTPRNTPQHTASAISRPSPPPFCNTLQHTTTHRNTPQHTASAVSRWLLPHPLPLSLVRLCTHAWACVTKCSFDVRPDVNTPTCVCVLHIWVRWEGQGSMARSAYMGLGAAAFFVAYENSMKQLAR